MVRIHVWEPMATDIEIRTKILAASLAIESLTSAFLANLLNIQDLVNSRTLGNKSSSFSFNQKIDLLIDIKALSKENKTKLTTFMEIRNQFMHNIDANTYENCMNALDGKDNYLLKQYPSDTNKSKEIRLEFAVNELITEVTGIISSILLKINDKVFKESELKVVNAMKISLMEAIKEIEIKYNQFGENAAEEGSNFTINQLRNLGTEMAESLYGLSALKMHFILHGNDKNN